MITFVVLMCDNNPAENGNSEIFTVVYVGEEQRCVDIILSLPKIKNIYYSVQKWADGKRVKE